MYTENLEMKLKIKKWYHENYPSDKLYKEIYNYVTFEDLFEALKNFGDVYETLGGFEIDTIIRERCFNKLSEILNVDYDVIYLAWLKMIKIL